MDRPIQLAKTNSSRRTSRVIWPNDDKAIGTYFHALIASLFPVVSMLGQRVGFPLFLLGAWLVLVEPSAGQSGTWTETGDLITARWDHTATLLPDGTVLVAGGGVFEGSASAELYDPASGTWTETGDLLNVRFVHTATLLPNGKVLVAGGLDEHFPPIATASAELYTSDGSGELTLMSAASRKTHGTKGDFDINLPLTGDLGIECRSGLTRYITVFSFNQEVTGADSAASSCGTVSSITVDPANAQPADEL